MTQTLLFPVTQNARTKPYIRVAASPVQTPGAFVDQGFVRNADDLSFSNTSAHALNTELTAGTMMYN